MANGPDILDPAALASLRELGAGAEQDLVTEIASLFCIDARKSLEEIRAAVQASDADAAGRIAHRLKSSSVYLGARFVTELASAMERLGRDGDLAGLAEQLPQLEREVERAIDVAAKL